MIYSMTGFAHTTYQQPWGQLSIEIRSINHRYLDMHFSLPDTWRTLEPLLREELKQHCKRGKIDVWLKYREDETRKNFIMQHHIVEQLVQFSRDITHYFPQNLHINPMDFLTYPGVVISADVQQTEAITNWMLQAFRETVQNLQESRMREGAAIFEHLHQLSHDLNKKTQSIAHQTTDIVASLQKKLQHRLEALAVNVDPLRMEQEIALLAQKYDIAEEIQRLHSHCLELHRILTTETTIGKKIEFLLQEIGRELNTLLAKVQTQDIIYAALEAKLFMERIREQVQNIE